MRRLIVHMRTWTWRSGRALSLMHGLPEPQRFEMVSSRAYADGCVAHVLRPS